MKSLKLFACAIVAALLSGCAFQNQSLTGFLPHQGYRLRNLSTNAVNSDEVFIVLSFSGGGTRAAAFSYGAMEELANTPIGHGATKRRLLDEVDLISSVSGGSFTAAYYALYRDRLFREFDQEFLKRNIQLGLGLRVLNPLNWPRLASPYFDRIDLAAEYYDGLMFRGHTYQDLLTNTSRPFIVLNATDMSLGSRFEFTQQQFDLLYSDLGGYPIARAVAASSAFPILLSPITLKNYRERPGYEEPGWISSGMDDADNNPGRFKIATIGRSYEDATNRPYIHLIDGGISDNIGLRGPSQSLFSMDGGDSIIQRINLRKIKKLAFITVNAKPGDSVDWDKKRRAPGVLSVMSTAISAPMDNYSFATVNSLTEKVDADYVKPKQTELSVIKRLKEVCPGANWPEVLPTLEFHEIELSFDKMKDPVLRKQLKELPTNFHLPAKDVDLLKRAARELLQQSSEFRALVNGLQ